MSEGCVAGFVRQWWRASGRAKPSRRWSGWTNIRKCLIGAASRWEYASAISRSSSPHTVKKPEPPSFSGSSTNSCHPRSVWAEMVSSSALTSRKNSTAAGASLRLYWLTRLKRLLPEGRIHRHVRRVVLGQSGTIVPGASERSRIKRGLTRSDAAGSCWKDAAVQQCWWTAPPLLRISSRSPEATWSGRYLAAVAHRHRRLGLHTG